MHRATGSKETIKRAGYSIAVEVVHKLRCGSRGGAIATIATLI